MSGYEIAAIILAGCAGLALVVFALGWVVSKTPPPPSDV